MKNTTWVIWFLMFSVLTLSGGAITTIRVNAQSLQPGDNAELAQNLIVKVIGDNVSGSGIVFGQMGEMLFIATANHVVRRGSKEAQNLSVGFKFWFEEIEATLLDKFDKDLDLAVLLVDLKNSNLDSQVFSQHLPLTQLSYASDIPDESNLYPIGHPPGVDWYIPKPPPQLHGTEGANIRFHFQCDQGYSGGGLFNEARELLGMIVRFNPPVCEAVSFERIQSTLEDWRFMVSLKPQETPIPVPTGIFPSPTAIPTPHSAPSQTIQLRSEPLIVSNYEHEKLFKIESDLRPPQYIKNDFDDQGNVVVDHVTGLMWQKSGSLEPLRYKDAWLYITQLNREQFAGYGDWRMPTISELLSLLEPKAEAYDMFYINPIFDAMRQRQCWSADKWPDGMVWIVDFLEGKVSWKVYAQTISTAYVRAVRSLP